MSLRVGFDLTDVEEVRSSVEAFGEQYLSRIYTDDERRSSRDSTSRLASHFAVKEAVMKALGSPGLPWRSIALHHDDQGRPIVRLSGPASELARCRGAGPVSVSLSRAAGHAAAVVVTEVDR